MYPILEKRALAEQIWLMKILAPRVARSARPGQFVIVRADERGERIDLRLLSLGGEDTAKTLRKVACVVQDLGGTVIWADEKQERN